MISWADEYRHDDYQDIPRTEARKVPGCESEVFSDVKLNPGGVDVRFAVDNPQGISAMALSSVLREGLKTEAPQAVASLPDDIVFRMFGHEISMGKSLGLTNMVRVVKGAAQTWIAEPKQVT